MDKHFSASLQTKRCEQFSLQTKRCEQRYPLTARYKSIESLVELQ